MRCKYPREEERRWPTGAELYLLVSRKKMGTSQASGGGEGDSATGLKNRKQAIATDLPRKCWALSTP